VRKKPGPSPQIAGRTRHVVISDRGYDELEQMRHTPQESIGHVFERIVEIHKRYTIPCLSCEIRFIKTVAAAARESKLKYMYQVWDLARLIGISHEQSRAVITNLAVNYFKGVIDSSDPYAYFKVRYQGLVSNEDIVSLEPVFEECKSILIDEAKKKTTAYDGRIDGYL
jgi:hypothetical protein